MGESPALQAPAQTPAVWLRGVSKTFDNQTEALTPISLKIPPGQFISILGPSGCGKSTLLRLVAGLEQPTNGTIDLQPERQLSLAYVFQDAHLLPWRNVLRNVALPLELRGETKRNRRAVAEGLLSQVGLDGFFNRYPAQLSGGMKMRVSLARALAINPRLLLLDEPFAALDEITRHLLDEQLLTLWRQRKMTVLFVTHSVAEAVFLSQRVIVLSARPGRIALDHRIDFSVPRNDALRSNPQFGSECGILYSALTKRHDQR